MSESSHTSVQGKTRVKICGITSVNDALNAVRCGADAIGLVFYSSSPRYVTVKQAAEIAYAVGPFVTVTGLFVNESAEFVEQVLRQVPLQLLQFHGDETVEFCEQFSRPYIKAMRMRDGLNVDEAIAGYSSAIGVLLDTYRAGVPGGTGEKFDWDRVPETPACPIILAGGLTPDNVAAAVAQVKPYGVDVSGGVESTPGQKSSSKVEVFIRNATTYNATRCNISK
ncbi:MAG: phosphoribosylanthranilate isomerase [Cellvibrionaceae bacterium]